MIVKGQGTRLYDETGREYLDTRNNVCHVGHCHPRVVAAVSQQVATLNTNTRYLHPHASLLAHRIANLLPDPLDVVFLVNSGSEANDLALRLARAYTKSRNTIVVQGGYHGNTLSVLEVSPYKYGKGTEFPLHHHHHHHDHIGGDTTVDAHPNATTTTSTPGPHIYQVPAPDTYRGLHRGKDAGERYATYVQEACQHYIQKGETVGAFIMEGGMSVG